MKKKTWKVVAKYMKETYGSHVDWMEGFFICPECGEPIYAVDWEDEELEICPVCEFEWFEEEKDDEIVDELDWIEDDDAWGDDWDDEQYND